MGAEPKLAAALTLDQAPFISGIDSAIKHAAHAARTLAAQFRASPVKFVATAGIVGAESAIRGMASGLGFIAKTGAYAMTALAGGAVAAGTALVAGTAGIIHMGSELEIMHRRTGMAIGRMAMLKRVLGDNGVEFESLVPTIKKMSVALETAQGNDPAGLAAHMKFADLGLDSKELYGQDPADVFTKIGAAISRMENPFQRASAAAAIFGRSGTMLLSAFSDKEGFAKAAGALGQKAILLEENAERFHNISVLMSHTGDGLKSFFIGFASGISGPLEAILEKFHAGDLSGVGLKFAEAMKTAAAWVMVAWQDPAGTAAYFWAELKLQAANFANAASDMLGKMFPDAVREFDQWIFSAKKFTAELASGIEFAFGIAKQMWADIAGTEGMKLLIDAGKVANDALGGVTGIIKAAIPGASLMGVAGAALNGGAGAAGEAVGPVQLGEKTYEEIRARRLGEITPPTDFIGPMPQRFNAGGLQQERDAALLNRQHGDSILEKFTTQHGNLFPEAPDLLGGNIDESVPDLLGGNISAPAKQITGGAVRLQGASLAGGLDRLKASNMGTPGGNLSTFNSGTTPDNILRHAERMAVRNSIIGGPDEARRLRAGGFSASEIHQGDAARRKAMAKEIASEQLRKATGKQNEGEALNNIAKTNTAIVKNTAALVKTFGEQPPEEVE